MENKQPDQKERGIEHDHGASEEFFSPLPTIKSESLAESQEEGKSGIADNR